MRPKLLMAGFFACAFVIICKTFRDYGVTWDEEYHQFYGTLIEHWYSSFFKDREAVNHLFLIYYGGFFDFLVQLASHLGSWDSIEARHFLGGVFGLWTVYISFKIGERIAGILAGFFSALFLMLHPVFYGHMFNNPVDIPFGAMLLTAFYFMIESYDFFPKIPLKQLLKIGVAVGLTFAIRMAGVLIVLPCFLVLWLLWFAGKQPNIKSALADCARSLAIVTAIAWPVMLIWWPWGQINPFIHPFKAFVEASQWKFNPETFTIFFEGKYYPLAEIPKSYLLKSILITLPEFFFVVLGLGMLQAITHLAEGRKPDSKENKIYFLIFALIFPPATALIMNVPQFDGFRHFLFLIPLLAVLGGISLAIWFESKTAKGIKVVLLSVVIFSLSLTGYDMLRLHPYQTVYFNRVFAGGLAEAAKLYETDYWGNSYREGILWVIKNYNPPFDRKIRILNASWPFQTAYYIDKIPGAKDRFEMVPGGPDIFLSTTRWDCHKGFNGKLLYQVVRDHAPLLYVMEVPENMAPNKISTCV